MNHLVLEALKEADRPLSVKEIARAIYVYEDFRQHRNFQDRCRRAIKQLLDEALIIDQVIPSSHQRNLLITVYAKQSEEARQQCA